MKQLGARFDACPVRLRLIALGFGCHRAAGNIRHMGVPARINLKHKPIFYPRGARLFNNLHCV